MQPLNHDCVVLKGGLHGGGRRPRQGTRTCHYCRKPGHLQRGCYARIKAEQEGYQAKALMAGLGASSSTAWLVESGASHHVCSNRAMLSDLLESRAKSVITATHGVAKVVGQGTLRLHVTVGCARSLWVVQGCGHT
jgi:hypothetical protein